MDTGRCETCFYHQSSIYCDLLKTRMSLTDYCSHYLPKDMGITECCYCGQLTINPILDYKTKTEECVLMCGKCLQSMGTCRMCKKSCRCEFEENPSTIPKIVRQRIQNNGMTIETDVLNPTRIELFCKNCDCFNGEECMRNYNTCSNYELRETVKK
jgi:hypothetical protein